MPETLFPCWQSTKDTVALMIMAQHCWLKIQPASRQREEMALVETYLLATIACQMGQLNRILSAESFIERN
jgi:hypothetical protein